jgi:predicted O-methyltransferase YrrM
VTEENTLPHRVIRRAARTARTVRAVVTRPPYVTPGHFYSPLTTDADVRRALTWTEAPGVDLAEASQLELATQVGGLLAEPPPGPRYIADNRMYGPADAAIYRAMLTYLRPARVIEVGSGYSTALALDESEANDVLAGLELTCIEPFPERLLGLLQESDRDRLTLIRQPVQEVEMAVYSRLGPQDVLFIDSTHVVKAGSDVVWLFLHVLPRLAPGVVVHVHDVFWPFEYPAEWLRQHRDWTENYLLHAFLADNARWEILLFSSWLWRCHAELVPQWLATESPGSIWLRKRGNRHAAIPS